jgi:hypothetical protein
VQVRLALRFVRRCRRIEAHPPQDRPNFGTDRVTYPDRVEVTRENARRQQGRPQSVLMPVRPLPTIAAAEYWNPPFGTHFDFGFAPPASDGARSALRLSHGTFRHCIPSVTTRQPAKRAVKVAPQVTASPIVPPPPSGVAWPGSYDTSGRRRTCRSRRAFWRRTAYAASLRKSSACGGGGRHVYVAGLNCSESAGRPAGIHRFSVRIGRVDAARFDFERAHSRDDHIDGRLSTLMASGPLINVCSWLRQNKSPVYAGIFCPRFRSMHRQIGRPVRPQIHTFRQSHRGHNQKLSPSIQNNSDQPQGLAGHSAGG